MAVLTSITRGSDNTRGGVLAVHSRDVVLVEDAVSLVASAVSTTHLLTVGRSCLPPLSRCRLLGVLQVTAIPIPSGLPGPVRMQTAGRLFPLVVGSGRAPHLRLALPDVGVEAAAAATIETPSAAPLAARTESIPSHLNRRLLFGSSSRIRERSNRWLLFESSKGVCGGLRCNYLSKGTKVAMDFAIPPGEVWMNPISGERRRAPEVGEPLVEIQNGRRGGNRMLYTRGAPRNPSSIALMAVRSPLTYVSRIRLMADRSTPKDPGSICHMWRSAAHVQIRTYAPVYRAPVCKATRRRILAGISAVRRRSVTYPSKVARKRDNIPDVDPLTGPKVACIHRVPPCVEQHDPESLPAQP
ncbi:uncharacterized protein [Triticum aestivum]|uniref:uncharacterized protein n=1 Tax=Triticum aestivum TaxID=4565 RepID=UPI001D0086CE|nr:uncharacterized protein LOC123097472 [Triticum aestivum]XP_044375161.1 uncharacterized protein LOC123097472 [Triticum aestivum]XP_044375162.1 uncharacterized protein LOC123097472 [Triticum aestivum]XP_044375163.1 uncharacterized protein LOC123097472 [Triticum aestivum]XP_044375164.1 uncharacterized protein LOC123097472 [Triticum aestivum]XP_044375165.1 uncharacterized protein LOC123097472 [Triticum aestivum]XP_044375166.1 uncharacterized protein LOC123097472 [Triticum aestivum]